ncbi:MAG: DUF5753 domain-containing protein [Pseudonocardiaceae bacterium]
MTSLNPRRARLAARLRSVRAAVFRSGQQFAGHLGWQQSRVSKLETGAQFPTEADIHAWVEATQASDDVRTELLELLAAARVEYTTNRDATRQGGLAGAQEHLAAMEAQSTRVAEWQPAMIPGIVQTAAYARELLTRPSRPSLLHLGETEIEALVTERIRRQEILYQPGRLIQVIVGQAALRSAPGAAETLIGQLDRLISVAGLSTVELGVVPFPSMPILPLCSFLLHDDHVLIETLTGEQRLDDPDELDVYVRAFERLREAAALGDDAVALIRRIVTEG